MNLFTRTFPHGEARLYAKFETIDGFTSEFWIGTWDIILRRWHPVPRGKFPESVKMINERADIWNGEYKLCPNCYGLKVVRVQYGKMAFNDIWTEKKCPFCKGQGVMQPFQQQECLAL